jgi:hypothetical protein
MSSICRYRGDRVDDSVAMGEAGHLFGPDICGSYIGDDDVRVAFRTGITDLVQRAIHQGLPTGAHYELVAASYDDTRDVTIAEFKPHINPLHRQRFHGGSAGPNLDPPTLAKRDKQMKQAR